MESQTDLSNKRSITKLFVLNIEGVHGVGKSTILALLRRAGYTTVAEYFLELIQPALDPSDISYKIEWMLRRYRTLIKLKDTCYVAFCDRSLYTSGLYLDMKTNQSETLIRLAEDMERELERQGIVQLNVFLKAKPETIWKRLQGRLKKDQIYAKLRKKLSENDKTHLYITAGKYEGWSWDHTIDIEDLNPKEATDKVIELFVKLTGGFEIKKKEN